MKRNYYYLVAGLQDITLDAHKLSMGQLEFREELYNEVHPSDFKLVEKLYLPYDNANLLSIITKSEEEFDPRGNYALVTFEENLKELAGELPEYMEQFILAYKADESVFQDMSSENQLTMLFYEYTRSLKDDFLRNWFLFNRDLRNITTALVCRKYDIPYENQIIGLDENAEAIRKSHARDFGLGSEISYLDDLLNIAKNDNVQEREKAIDQIKWNYLDEVTFFEYFTMDKLLSFAIKLGMVERWLSIDKDHGSRMFEELLQELKSSYNLPETFTEK